MFDRLESTYKLLKNYNKASHKLWEKPTQIAQTDYNRASDAYFPEAQRIPAIVWGFYTLARPLTEKIGRIQGRILKGALIVGGSTLAGLAIDAGATGIGSMLNNKETDLSISTPGPETIRRSTESNYVALNIPVLPSQR